jgi:hypothetical protein
MSVTYVTTGLVGVVFGQDDLVKSKTVRSCSCDKPGEGRHCSNCGKLRMKEIEVCLLPGMEYLHDDEEWTGASGIKWSVKSLNNEQSTVHWIGIGSFTDVGTNDFESLVEWSDDGKLTFGDLSKIKEALMVDLGELFDQASSEFGFHVASYCG